MKKAGRGASWDENVAKTEAVQRPAIVKMSLSVQRLELTRRASVAHVVEVTKACRRVEALAVEEDRHEGSDNPRLDGRAEIAEREQGYKNRMMLMGSER